MNYTYSPDPFDRRSIRQYAVVIYLPDQIEEMIRPLRERFDTDHNIIAAHITVVFPFETDRDLESISTVVRNQIRNLLPFDLELNSIGDFYPQSPIIYWQVKGTPDLNELHTKLYIALQLPVLHKSYVPHVTIGREISPHRLLPVKDTIASYLPRERFTVNSVDLVAPIADGSWVSVRSFRLGPELSIF